MPTACYGVAEVSLKDAANALHRLQHFFSTLHRRSRDGLAYLHTDGLVQPASPTADDRLMSSTMVGRAREPAAARPEQRERLRDWLRPARWGISARSAIVSAIVVLFAVLLTGAVLLLILYRSLLSSIDDAAAGRVRDTIAALDSDSPSELDTGLLAGDQRVLAVQVIGSDGKVLRRSASAPEAPLLPSSYFGTTLRTGISDDNSPHDDMRMSVQTATTGTGRYTVIAGAGSEPAEATILTVALLLGIAAPIITGAAAVANYLLVKRSLRSVEAIRSRVSEISASDLAERVPVPPQNDEISALAKTMNLMLGRLEEGQAVQRRFVGDASHELRSPLASIISALEVARDYPETLDRDLTDGVLMPEAQRMEALVEDLLLLARADERGLSIREEEIDLDVLVEGEVVRLRRETSHNINIRAEPTAIKGDIRSVGRMLRNLLDNAVRHAKSRVDIGLNHSNGTAVLRIADDGPGIPIEDRNRIFDRFVRLDQDRSRQGGGAGLGLAIVAEIVAAHGAAIRVDDLPSGGTVFIVTFVLT